MARTQNLVQLSDRLVALLDRQAETRGVSRSYIIREAVEQHLKAEVEADLSQQIIDGYARIPQATPDAWGNPASHTASGARELFRRLDEEERREGHAKW